MLILVPANTVAVQVISVGKSQRIRSLVPVWGATLQKRHSKT